MFYPGNLIGSTVADSIVPAVRDALPDNVGSALLQLLAGSMASIAVSSLKLLVRNLTRKRAVVQVGEEETDIDESDYFINHYTKTKVSFSKIGAVFTNEMESDENRRSGSETTLTVEILNHMYLNLEFAEVYYTDAKIATFKAALKEVSERDRALILAAVTFYRRDDWMHRFLESKELSDNNQSILSPDSRIGFTLHQLIGGPPVNKEGEYYDILTFAKLMESAAIQIGEDELQRKARKAIVEIIEKAWKIKTRTEIREQPTKFGPLSEEARRAGFAFAMGALDRHVK